MEQIKISDMFKSTSTDKNCSKTQNKDQQDEKEQIQGLYYTQNFISKEEEKLLLEQINKMSWNTQLKRRTQHYGYTYDYTSKSISEDDYLGELPQFCDQIIDRMLEQKIVQDKPDQLIINEYEPGQGINSHIDKANLFMDTVISISLGSQCIMDFTKENQGKKEEVPVLLHRRSLVKLSGDSRYQWKHGIKARKTDKINGIPVDRRLRVSLTFRNIIKKKIKQE